MAREVIRQCSAESHNRVPLLSHLPYRTFNASPAVRLAMEPSYCPHSSLTQSQAARGRTCFERWLSTRKRGDGSAMAASALPVDKPGDPQVG